MSTKPHPSIRLGHGRFFTNALAIGVAIAGILILAGWLFNIAPLQYIWLPGEPIKPTIGAATFLCGFALVFLSWRQRSSRMHFSIAAALALIVSCLSAAVLVEAIFGVDIGIDQLLAFGRPEPTQNWHWHMMPGTAFSFLVISIALLMATQVRTRARLWLISGLSASQLIPAIIALAGFAVEKMLGAQWNLMGMTVTGVPIAIAFVLLSIGLLARLHSAGDFTWALDGMTTGGFAVGILIMLATAASAFSFAKQMRDTNELLAHRQEALNQIEEIVSEVEDLSSSERGYIITGNVQRDSERGEVKAALSENLVHVRVLTSSNPNQQARLDRLEPLISQRIAWEEKVIATRREKGFAEAAAMTATESGATLLARIQGLLGELQAEEYRLLSGDEKKAEAAATATFLLLPLGVFLSLAVLSLGFFFLNSGMGERAQSERALRQAERKYRSIFENAIEGIYQSTPDGQYLIANPALAKMYGYDSPEELIASITDIAASVHVDPARRAEFKKLMEERGFVDGFEYQMFRKDRSRIWVSATGRAVRGSDGKILYYEGSCVDITEHKRVDEVERANAAKSEFLSRMSHELRTPLNAILGFGQLLERQNPTETQRSYVGHIVKAGRHLLDLINEVLDISRIESGRLELSTEPVRVGEVLEEALDLVRTQAADRRIKLSGPSAEGASRYLLADRQRLKQVLVNLLSNAVKYTPEGGRVIASIDPAAKGMLRIGVDDSGPGIPKENLPRLFVPFDRLGAEQSTIEGTGLGLAVCRSLMQAMDGSIGVESVLRKGSTFWIELPETESPLKALASSQQIHGRRFEQRPATLKHTVLHIEDNASNITLIQELMMQRDDISLLTAKQGYAGFKMAQFYLPDLILLDMQLPDMSGSDVLSKLRAENATRNIPVVIISADATQRQIDRLIGAGASDYLTKPIDVDQFFAVIEKTLQTISKTSEYAAA